ncbi:alpha-2-macroglobulin receptor-associated protein [Aplysia californica]|uniref:Alpha-2-macroglobulin receptor-associated protein n=1 Tax=Aplysia californica TaxID=6500 RepID=A0ABM0JI77_APLCA|nr:alpha-2-macroglobulin receptor-associated protein [Aplysia californica]
MKMLCKVILLLVVAASVQASNKYSKEANEDDDTFTAGMEYDPSPFRMQKVNLLWNKAKKRVSGQDLADLYADLKVHDKYEANLKKVRSENKDEDGTIEEKVLTNYKRIMTRYLPDSLPAESRETNEIPLYDDFYEPEKEVFFQDSKLQNMWVRAQQAGFSEEDLNTLKVEFEHQQMKIHEFEFVHRELYNNAGTEDNTVDVSQMKLNLSPDEVNMKVEELKNTKTNVKEGFMKLEKLASSLPSSEPAFQDSRVQALWSMAKKTNWTSEELSSFQEELHHFETRVSKHRYYVNELKYAKEAVEAGEGEESIEKHEFLTEKASVMKKTIGKIHSGLKERVEEALEHIEL